MVVRATPDETLTTAYNLNGTEGYLDIEKKDNACYRIKILLLVLKSDYNVLGIYDKRSNYFFSFQSISVIFYIL